MFEVFRDSLKRLAETILLLENTKYDKKIQVVLNKVNVCIVKIANASEDEHINDYMFFDEYYNDNFRDINQLLIEAMKPIKNNIVDCFENEIIDTDYVRKVIKQHNQEMKTYSESRKNGGHVSFNFDYLRECRETI